MYVLDSNLNATFTWGTNENWDVADIIFNLSFDKNYIYNHPRETETVYHKATAGHEIGHALGLNHTTDNGTLMYTPHSTRTATSPTADEVRGVSAIYG